MSAIAIIFVHRISFFWSSLEVLVNSFMVLISSGIPLVIASGNIKKDVKAIKKI